jgi:hypothetical protein
MAFFKVTNYTHKDFCSLDSSMAISFRGSITRSFFGAILLLKVRSMLDISFYSNT